MHDDYYDGLPPSGCEPPSFAEETLAWSVRFAVHSFGCVESDRESAHYHLSHGCLQVQTLVATIRSGFIAPRLRDDLLQSILRAQFVFREITPDHAIGGLLRGFEGLIVLASYLAETDVQRGARHPDVVRDAQASVRIMRNCAHNEELAREIDARADARRRATVDSLLSRALQAAA